jgi:hypothetical protein
MILIPRPLWAQLDPFEVHLVCVPEEEQMLGVPHTVWWTLDWLLFLLLSLCVALLFSVNEPASL